MFCVVIWTVAGVTKTLAGDDPISDRIMHDPVRVGGQRQSDPICASLTHTPLLAYVLELNTA